MNDWHVLGLSGDPTPGDPHGTRDLAARLRREGESTRQAALSLRQLLDSEGQLAMVGGFADRYRHVLGGLRDHVTPLATAYDQCGQALAEYAVGLDDARARSRAALCRGREAHQRYHGAVHELRSLLPSGGPVGVAAGALPHPLLVETAIVTLDPQTQFRARTALQRAQAADADRQRARRLAADAAALHGDAQARCATAIDAALDEHVRNRVPGFIAVVDFLGSVRQRFDAGWTWFADRCRDGAAAVGVVLSVLFAPLLRGGAALTLLTAGVGALVHHLVGAGALALVLPATAALGRDLRAMARGLAHAGTLVGGVLEGPGPARTDLPPGVPDRGRDAGAVARWWLGLSAEQRDRYVADHSRGVGALDGIPAVDRDRANRRVLEDYLAHTAGQDGDARDRALRLRDRLLDSDLEPPARRLYLLSFDNSGDGRAAVAVGNPDTARHTAVVVPGITTTLTDLARGQLTDAYNLQVEADNLTPGPAGDVCVIAWLGYDAPGVLDAGLNTRAVEGGRSLHSFVAGLRATHDGPAAHLTAIGHSYGSAVIGESDRAGGRLAVDDVAVVGSPGMDVGSVHELSVEPRHVWAAENADDLVPVLPTHEGSPADRSFGANRFRSDGHSHGSYFDPGSVSQRNLAAVAVGQYDQVSLVHGAPPAGDHRPGPTR